MVATQAHALVLESSAFKEGGTIPTQYTCRGNDLSPPLSWKGTSAQVKSFALIMEDPDAPSATFTHWVVFNLPASMTSLSEGIPPEKITQEGAKQGSNSFKMLGYRGPCPPPGPAHRYFFKIFSLDSNLDLSPGATKADLERAMQGHILGQAQLMGKFGR